jgi:hypothetical protein
MQRVKMKCHENVICKCVVTGLSVVLFSYLQLPPDLSLTELSHSVHNDKCVHTVKVVWIH